jgi:uncharacterized protein
MPERDGYMPGVPCWIDTSQPEPEAAVDFYSGLFGWEFEDVMPPDSPGKYFIARIRGGDVAAVGSIPEGAPPQAMWNTYVWVDSADETAAKVKDAGGAIVMEPFDVSTAGRMAVFSDPEGAVFCVWQANEHKGARIVNEPVSLVFNALNTRDRDGAIRFYGSVFGWTTLALSSEFWTQPGYGDHLAESNPDLRRGIKEFGVDERFADVVAAINPIPDDQPDTPAHWSVTFAVDDPDATAERAKELGATVVSPPIDVPWSRVAVLADPQGATFIASKFAPENRDIEATA